MTKAIKYDTANLDKILRSLKDEHFLRVGILGSKAHATHDKKSGKTNAEIGSYHEFGSDDGKHPPRRSFLEDSLKLKLNFNSEKFKQLRKKCFNSIFVKIDAKEFLTELGAKCLQIIEDGFASNGFGMWKPLSDARFAYKYDKNIKGYNRLEKAMIRGKVEYNKQMLDEYLNQVHNPLILTDTGKLRHSITFKVIKRK